MNLKLAVLNVCSRLCHLEYVQVQDDLEESFGQVTVFEEDEEVVEKQLAEDVSLYGSRPDPPDAIEMDEQAQLSHLMPPPKRSAAQFEDAVSRPAEARKKSKSKDFNYQTITAMDWNSGATPLDAWLNQSALPSVLPLSHAQQNQFTPSNGDFAIEELEELNVFRSIHIKEGGKRKGCEKPRTSTIDTKLLEPRTQIYLRNIEDRYPLLPPYLALRLADANCARAERLDLARQASGEKHSAEIFQVDKYKCVRRDSSFCNDKDLTPEFSVTPAQQSSSQSWPLGFPPLLPSRHPKIDIEDVVEQTKDDLNSHAKRNADGKYPCKHCPSTYLHAKHLKRHMLRRKYGPSALRTQILRSIRYKGSTVYLQAI